MAREVTRPVLRYLGGKYRLAPWIIGFFPSHRIYVEPYGGAASVLLRKPRSMGECYNDLDGNVVNLFTVLRDPLKAARLRELLTLTPFSREEYDRAFEAARDDVEDARRLIVRSYMGHGSSSAVRHKNTGFRASMVNRGGALPAGDWTTLPAALEAVTDRLRGVVIESRPALQVIDRYDEEGGLIYLDPPYVPETRSTKKRGGAPSHAYVHEMSVADHAQLLERANACAAAVVISGYPCRLYDDALDDWERVEIDTHADGALDRTEVVWINQVCASRLRAEQAQLSLLDHEAA